MKSALLSVHLPESNGKVEINRKGQKIQDGLSHIMYIYDHYDTIKKKI
mgnify:CR=1 FL=1